MKRKIKLSFEALERELSQISSNQLLSVIGGNDPTDCFFRTFSSIYQTNVGGNMQSENAASIYDDYHSLTYGFNMTNPRPSEKGADTLSAFNMVNNAFDNVKAFNNLQKDSYFDEMMLDDSPNTSFFNYKHQNADGTQTDHTVEAKVVRKTESNKKEIYVVDHQNPNNSGWKDFDEIEFHSSFTIGEQDDHNQFLVRELGLNSNTTAPFQDTIITRYEDIFGPSTTTLYGDLTTPYANLTTPYVNLTTPYVGN